MAAPELQLRDSSLPVLKSCLLFYPCLLMFEMGYLFPTTQGCLYELYEMDGLLLHAINWELNIY